MFHHGIDDREKFTHTSCYCHFRLFASLYQSGIEFLDHWIELCRRQRCHVEYAANMSSSSPYRSSPSHISTIPVGWRYPHKCRYFFCGPMYLIQANSPEAHWDGLPDFLALPLFIERIQFSVSFFKTSHKAFSFQPYWINFCEFIFYKTHNYWCVIL
jgi:hypothetical protein